MNIFFLMDPLESVKKDKDTSFILMVGFRRRGHKTFFIPSGGIFFKEGKVCFHATEVIPQVEGPDVFEMKETSFLSQENMDVLFIRTDPPFDEEYLNNTWLLDLLPERILIINKPSGIRSANEKIWTAQFTSITPKTIIGRDKKQFLDFLKEEKEIIAKPTHAFGGQSVFYIKFDDTNANVIFETLTDNYSQDIILQKFVKEAARGDKRILLLDGKPLGAVMRIHKKGDHRNNFFSGGKAVATEIGASDEKIINCIKPKLKDYGLFFVGIDIIGNYLIEINVTSPTCMQEMNRLYHLQLEDKVVAFAEHLAT